MKHLKKGITVLIIITLLAGISPNVLYSSIIANATSCYQDLYDGEYSSNLGEYAANIAGANYGREMWSYYKQAWCADFACDCWRKVGVGTDIVPNEPSAPGLVTWFMNNDPSGVYYRQSGNSSYSTFKKGYYEPKKGDIVGICNGASGCLGKDGFGSGNRHCVDHIGIIYNVTDDKIITMEGNCGDPSKVKSYEYNWNNGTSNGYGYTWNGKEAWIQYVCHPAYTDIVVTPPTNIWISLPNGPESSYLLNSSVDITFGADDASSYHIDMYRSTGGAAEYYWGGWFYSTSGSDTCYASFDKTGHYSCTVTAYNSAGEIQSSWIGWDIVDEAPKNVWVSLPNGPESSYLPNTTVEITFGAEYADTFQIRMCREYDGIVDWEYYIHSFKKDPAGNNICYASFDKLGHYSCYIWATNVVGGTNSEWIGWDIVDSAPSSLSISTDKNAYTVNSTVNFTLNATYGYYKHIGIHKIVNSQNQLYHEQDVAGTNCSVKITEPGYYCANFDAFNASGTKRSDFVYFKVFVPGDIDEDGDIGLKDVVQLTRYLAGGWDVTLDMTIADINKDGEVNLKDTVLLRRYLVGGWGIQLD